MLFFILCLSLCIVFIYCMVFIYVETQIAWDDEHIRNDCINICVYLMKDTYN